MALPMRPNSRQPPRRCGLVAAKDAVTCEETKAEASTARRVPKEVRHRKVKRGVQKAAPLVKDNHAALKVALLAKASHVVLKEALRVKDKAVAALVAPAEP